MHNCVKQLDTSSKNDNIIIFQSRRFGPVVAVQAQRPFN